MPGVVTMDHGGPEASRTDHDTSLKANGVNGTSNDASHNQPTKEAATHPSDSLERSALYPSRMNDLPDEIVHITQGFIPLSALLTRLAQSTHNSLQDAIIEIAKMPVPAAAMNGNVAHSSTSDDSSAENIRKKAALLNFAQDHHAKWVKALVITEWSRKTDKVSKLIDLKFHIDQQRMLYDAAVDNMVNLKRDLTYARMPSPDLKTALQILSTGSAPWMPDVSTSLLSMSGFLFECLKVVVLTCVLAPIHRASALDTRRATQVDQRSQHSAFAETEPRRV